MIFFTDHLRILFTLSHRLIQVLILTPLFLFAEVGLKRSLPFPVFQKLIEL